jgi:L-lactate dehydrogenase complex protein LldF
MPMHSANSDFKSRASEALANASLQRSFADLKSGFVAARSKIVAAMPQFEDMREAGAAIKDHTLAHLDFYLERYEQEVVKQGGHVHWATDAEDACRIIKEICAQAGAKSVVKGKSMVSEEIELNAALEDDGFDVVETDAGEYIVQLADEAPSHIVMPTIHKTTADVADLFYDKHRKYGFETRAETAAELIGQVRTIMRRKYFAADVGITGANFLVAETGSNIIVTNEGNGDLSSTLARVHIVTAGIEKLVPTLNDATLLLRLLARSALGIEVTSYTTIATGPRRPGDLDGPEEYHVVLVDNGRTKMLAGAYRSMLRCIRCGACMNHCPVYLSVGGHAYGWVYPGPMGAVLTPMIAGHEKGNELPHACTLNGRCQQVCPVKIPLPEHLRRLRHDQWEAGFIKGHARWGLSVWAWFATKPRIYRAVTRIASALLGKIGRSKGRFSYLPFAGGWTGGRDMPTPQGETFHDAWASRKKSS